MLLNVKPFYKTNLSIFPRALVIMNDVWEMNKTALELNKLCMFKNFRKQFRSSCYILFSNQYDIADIKSICCLRSVVISRTLQGASKVFT